MEPTVIYILREARPADGTPASPWPCSSFGAAIEQLMACEDCTGSMRIRRVVDTLWHVYCRVLDRVEDGEHVPDWIIEEIAMIDVQPGVPMASRGAF